MPKKEFFYSGTFCKVNFWTIMTRFVAFASELSSTRLLQTTFLDFCLISLKRYNLYLWFFSKVKVKVKVIFIFLYWYLKGYQKLTSDFFLLFVFFRPKIYRFFLFRFFFSAGATLMCDPVSSIFSSKFVFLPLLPLLRVQFLNN